MHAWKRRSFWGVGPKTMAVSNSPLLYSMEIPRLNWAFPFKRLAFSTGLRLLPKLVDFLLRSLRTDRA
jgi:hypothetical protein